MKSFFGSITTEGPRLIGAITQLGQDITGEINSFKQLGLDSDVVMRAMCAHYHSMSEWEAVESPERAAYQESLEALYEQRRVLMREIKVYRNQLRAKERTKDIQNIREDVRAIELEAEQARIVIVRNALLTVEGLPHTDHRPSGWWIPMVDRSGEWFKEIAATAHLYREPLQTLAS